MYDKSISCSSLTRYIDHHQQQIISEKNGIRLRQHYLRSGSNIVQTRTLLKVKDIYLQVNLSYVKFIINCLYST